MTLAIHDTKREDLPFHIMRKAIIRLLIYLHQSLAVVTYKLRG